MKWGMRRPDEKGMGGTLNPSAAGGGIIKKSEKRVQVSGTVGVQR